MKSPIAFIKSVVFIVLISTTLFSDISKAETDKDYDGDGVTDFLAIRREPQTAQMQWWILKSSGGYSMTSWGRVFGLPLADIPLYGDFDGDRKTDIAVFRKQYVTPQAETYFYILRSGDNSIIAQQWGLSDDFPIVQDYDGDGKTDITVVRVTPIPGGGMTWYMLQSRNGYQSILIQKCCTPLPGDYDGDGRGDFAIAYSEGTSGIYKHYIVMSRQKRAIFRTFGTASHQFVPCDYDGDGKTDIAMRHSGNKGATGIWQWLRSSDGQLATANFTDGVIDNDAAVPGDYDGDRICDPAIKRQGSFIIRGSRNGLYTVQWGLPGDMP